MAILISDVRGILESAYDVRKEVVPCFIGMPGIGKTDGICQFAKDKEVKLVTFILSNTIPSEVSGIRMPDRDTKSLEVFDDSRMASLEDGDILFFDEILEAPRELWSACLTLIQSRIMASGRSLPDVMIVAASNPIKNPAMIPASVKDRFMMLDVQWERNNWIEWFRSKFRCQPDRYLVDCIENSVNTTTESATYNTLTPRRVVKLCEWWISSMNDDAKSESFKKAVECMFGQLICDAVIRTFRDMSWKARLKIELNGMGVTLDGFDDIPMHDMLDALMKHEEWESIKKILESVEIETGEK